MDTEVVKTSKGMKRQKHLDRAEELMIQGNYDQAKGELFNFVETINELSEAGQRLKKEWDEVFINWHKKRFAYEKKYTSAGFLEQSIGGNQILPAIDIDTLRELKLICKNIAYDFKLFDDDSEIDYPL